MTFDSECHLGERRPLRVEGEPLWVPRLFHIDDWVAFRPGIEPEEDLACLIATMDHFGIAKSIVQRGRCRQSNDVILDAIRRYPDRLVGFASYGLYRPDRTSRRQTRAALEELERGLAGGCLGVGELPLFDLGVPPEEVHLELRPVLEICAQRHLPVLFHTGCDAATHFVDWTYAEREDRQPNSPPYRVLPAPSALRNPAIIETLAFEFPSVPLLIGHMGRGDLSYFEAALMVARRFPNVYLTTSLTTREFVERAVREVGPERIIFGTDWKRSEPDAPIDDPRAPHAAALTTVAGARLSDSAKELILGQNLERLLAEVKRGQ